MSLRRKLTLLLGVIGLLLALFAGSMVWNAAMITKETRHVREETRYFKDLGRIRMFHYRQMHAATEFLLSGDEENSTDFDSLDEEIAGLFKALRREASSADDEKLAGAETDYRRIIAMVQTAFALKARGKLAEALRVMDEQAEPLSTGIFQEKVDGLMALYVLRIEGCYDDMILHLGALPWPGGGSLKTIGIARSAIRYHSLVDRIALLINGQVKELLNYLAAPTAKHKARIDDFNRDVKRAFAGWDRVVRDQEALGVEGEAEDLKVMRTVEHAYYEILESAKAVQAGHGPRASREMRTRFMIDNVLLSTLDAALYDSRAEIEDAHNRLVSSILTAGALSMIAIAAAGCALFWASQRLIRDMISGIRALKAGTDIIGSGYLDHRIVVAGNDELGMLAQSFNRMTAALKEGNDDLRSVIYSLSHDLRSPLVNMGGFSGELAALVRELDALLRRSRVSSSEQDQARLKSLLEQDLPAMLGFIGTASEKINDQMNAVLKLSLAGQAELLPERIELADLFRSVEGRYAGELARKNATLTIGDLPWVIADRNAMREIAGHLLDNAVKYLDPGRPGRVTVFGQRAEGGALVHVRDNGRGIAKEDGDRIFGLFRRSGQPDVPGEGMGLAYVKALVRRHNGSVWYESQFGEGTTFSVSIPDLNFTGVTM